MVDPKIEALAEMRELLRERRRRRIEEPLQFYRALPHQAKFHASKARERVICAANRAGKTEPGVVQDIRRAKGEDPHWPDFPVPNIGWVISVSNEAQREILQPKFEKYLGKPGRDYAVRNRRGGIWDQIILPNRSVIGLKSCEMERKVFQGAAIHWAHFDEEPDQDIFEEVLTRLTDFGGDLWATFTPINGMTFTYDRWVDPETLVKDSEVFKASMWDNAVSVGGYIPDEEIRRFEESVPDPVMRKIRVWGEYQSQAGRIYKSFDRRIHGIDALPREMLSEKGTIREGLSTTVSIDTGRSFAAGFYVVDFFGNIFRFDEYYAENLTIHEHATAVNNMVAQHGIDPDFIIDPSSQFRLDLAEHGINAVLGDNEVQKGIEACQEYLYVKPGKSIGPQYTNPKFYVVTGGGKNRRFLWEIQRYQWADPARSGNAQGEKKNEPRKKDDHCCDELRYLCVTRPEPSKPSAGEEDFRPIERQIRDRVKERLKERANAPSLQDEWGLNDW